MKPKLISKLSAANLVTQVDTTHLRVACYGRIRAKQLERCAIKIKFKTLNQKTPVKLADKTEIPAFTLMGDNLAKKVLEEVGAIRKGLISLTPYHPNYKSPDEIVGSASPCYSYCSMRNVCRTSEGVLKSRG